MAAMNGMSVLLSRYYNFDGDLVSDSVTLNASTAYLAVVEWEPSTTTLTSLTHFDIVRQETWAGPNGHALLRALPTSNQTGALTLVFSDTVPQGHSLVIYELTGDYDTSGVNGANLLVQTAHAIGTSDAPLATLAAFSDARNSTFGAVQGGGAVTPTAGDGFTAVVTTQGRHNVRRVGQWRADNATTVDGALFSPTVWAVYAAEIRAAATGFGRAVVNLTGQNIFNISQNPTSGFRVRIE